MGEMRAVVANPQGTRLSSRAVPVCPPGWVRLRVLLAGICLTDVHAATGLLPLGGERVLGHEMVGEVVEANDAFEAGARVTVAPLVPCAACDACRRRERCATPRMLGVDVDGAFAEQVIVPASCVHRVPASLPLRRAAYVEPLAAALAVTRAPIQRGQRGCVLGDGRIADLTARVLRARGFDVSAAPARGPCDFVVEAAGTEAALAEALRVVRPEGVVVLKSRPARPVSLDVAHAVRNDVTLAAVSYGSYDEAIRLAGELAIDDLLGDVYPLARFDAAMAVTRAQPLGPKIFLSPRRTETEEG
jgi:threonine dehydrogenase-like Zn-dependent dehydrogenase